MTTPLKTVGELSDYLAKSLQLAHAAARLNTPDIEKAFAVVQGESVTKAMDTAEVAGGFEFVPTNFSPDVINQVRLELKVSSIFQHIYMPTPTYKIPVEVGPATAYIVPENTADTGQTAIPASQPGTGQITLTSVSMGAMTRISKELDQDSIAPMVPFIQRNLLRGLAAGLETAIINGDVSATHQDADVTASNATAKAFPGLRKLALSNNVKIDNGGGAITLFNMRRVRALMGIYGYNQTELVWIVGPATYQQMLNIPEVSTLDKFGPQATVLVGEMTKIDGIPVIVSPFMRETLNASGVYDGTTVNRGVAILAHREAFIVGDRQTIELDQDNTPKELRQIKLLADMRVAFAASFPVSANPTVGALYNIGL
jgi:HK97 family phage major capsid protein